MRSLLPPQAGDADAPPDLEQHKDASGERDCEDDSGQDDVHREENLKLDEFPMARTGNSDLICFPLVLMS
jgi:hypothetical protein